MSNRLSSSAVNKGSHWYPTEDQVKSPRATTQALRIVLDQFYALQDQHDALKQAHEELKSRVPAGASGGPPPGSGPTDSMLLGLRVAPIDTQTKATGSALSFDAPSGQLKLVTPAAAVSPPAHTSSPGAPGQIAFDSGFIYVSIGVNSWLRAALSGGF